MNSLLLTLAIKNNCVAMFLILVIIVELILLMKMKLMKMKMRWYMLDVISLNQMNFLLLIVYFFVVLLGGFETKPKN